MKLESLVGSARKIALLFVPFLLAGGAFNVFYPERFAVGGPSPTLGRISVVVLIAGLVNWAWSVSLLLTKAKRNELIRTGPYAVTKHPLYTGMALLVLPWLGFLLNSWLGVVLGLVLYVASRIYAPLEEQKLAEAFGRQWETYLQKVWLPWL